MTPSDKLVAFLREQFAPTAEGSCRLIRLGFLGARFLAVKGFEYADGASPDPEAEATKILAATKEDAKERIGMQRYQVHAYRGDATDPTSSLIFRVEGGGADAEGDDEMEGPSERGLMIQQMRHNEVLVRALMSSAQTMLVEQGKTIEAQAIRIAGYEQRHIQSVQVFEDLQTQQHARKLAEDREALKTRLLSEGVDKLGMLLPVVVNKLAGFRLLPETVAIGEQMLGQFMETLTQEQMAKLTGVLTPDQMMMVVELIRRRDEQLAKAKAEGDERVRKLRAPENGAKVEPGGKPS